jgi:hypothetical protein
MKKKSEIKSDKDLELLQYMWASDGCDNSFLLLVCILFLCLTGNYLLATMFEECISSYCISH